MSLSTLRASVSAERIAHLPVIAAALVLAIEPARWLIASWIQPAYGSNGHWVALLVVALFAWSRSSPLLRPEPAPVGVIWLLAASTAVRGAGQLLGISIVGALTLAVDVYALARLARLDVRVRALSPAWLAVLFCFALPLERVLQRAIGFVLQSVSAEGACALLAPFADSLTCSGVRIILDGRDVLVDLPCSGASGLTTLMMLFAALAALCRPTWLRAALGCGLVVIAGFMSNSVRIAALAVGLAHPERLGGIDVMAAPWHELIGLFALVLGLLPVLVWAADTRPVPYPRSRNRPPVALPYRAAAGALALAAALVVVSLSPRPVDVARYTEPFALPPTLAGWSFTRRALSDTERNYFVRYGGMAAKGDYGPFGVVVVRTTAPLRHLHGPDECLRGAGYAVRYRGAALDAYPTALYEATAPSGERLEVAVRYLSDTGQVTSNIAEAVWRWLNQEAGSWTMVQRITPVAAPPDLTRAFDAALMAALDAPPASIATMEY